MLGESFYPCTPLLASRLDLSWVGYFAAAPIEPFMSAIWPECPRRHFVPNPLSYFPQMGQSTTSQFMVRPDPSPPHSPSDSLGGPTYVCMALLLRWTCLVFSTAIEMKTSVGLLF